MNAPMERDTFQWKSFKKKKKPQHWMKPAGRSWKKIRFGTGQTGSLKKGRKKFQPSKKPPVLLDSKKTGIETSSRTWKGARYHLFNGGHGSVSEIKAFASKSREQTRETAPKKT